MRKDRPILVQDERGGNTPVLVLENRVTWMGKRYASKENAVHALACQVATSIATVERRLETVAEADVDQFANWHHWKQAFNEGRQTWGVPGY